MQHFERNSQFSAVFPPNGLRELQGYSDSEPPASGELVDVALQR